MIENNVVQLRKTVRKPAKVGDEKLADDVRKAHKKLCKVIDAAAAAGLKVELLVDSSDTLHGGRVRCRNVTITKTV